MVINFITLQNLLLSAIKVLFQTQSPFPKDRKKEKEKGKKKLLGPVWYVCLKTKICCLKTFVKIRVGEKMC